MKKFHILIVMSRKKIIQLIAVFFLILAVILLIPNTTWNKRASVFGFISLICGTIGSVISIFIPVSYSFNFLEKHWENFGDRDFRLFISSKKHGLGNSPQVQTFRSTENSFEEIGVYSSHDIQGNVMIGASTNFCGKVVIT